MSSVQLQSLERGFEVDQAINTEPKQFLIIRFGNKKACEQIDKWLAAEGESIKDKAAIYTVESSSVPELVARYNLSGPTTIMFFSNRTVFDRIPADNITGETALKTNIKQIIDKNPQTKRRGRRSNYY